MLSTYTWPRYEAAPLPVVQPRVPLVIVGAGLVGLTLAIDAAQRGLSVLLLDEDNTVSIGSRAVCHAKRTLEIFDRLGVGDAVVERGVTWNVGRTFHRDREVFSFNLLPESGHRRPGMVNLQQYHLEQLLVERALQLSGINLRWLHKVVDIQHGSHGATLQVQAPDGNYSLDCDWLVAADGARSSIRSRLGLDIEGKVFQDRFLIADVVLAGDPFPADRTERRFWFDPPFHPGQSVLMHRQTDNVWRIDFQLGWDSDPEVEKQPDRVAPRIRQVLDSQGFQHIGFELEWVSVYTFQCRRMAQFRHGRVLFVGDAAHQVSPFGARGGNSGVQDADNLGWKLALVASGQAPHSLLDSYHAERAAAADENIANSSRSTDFMTPKSSASRLLRNAVLSLAAAFPGARGLVNSGRLSVASVLANSPLNTPDSDPFEGWMQPGTAADGAPLDDGRCLLQALPDGFALLLFEAEPSAAQRQTVEALATLLTTLVLPPDGAAAQRYDARPGTCYLLRPDQHVAARWRRLDATAVRAALLKAST